MRIDDRIVGIGLTLLALCVIWEARQIPAVPGATFGPSLMPTLVGIVMAGCGIAILLGGLRAARGPLMDVSVWKGQRRGLLCAAWAIGGVMLGIICLPWLGFPLFGLLYILPLMLLMGARPVATVPVALVLVVGCYLLFKHLFHVPLPTGPVMFLG